MTKYKSAIASSITCSVKLLEYAAPSLKDVVVSVYCGATFVTGCKLCRNCCVDRMINSPNMMIVTMRMSTHFKVFNGSFGLIFLKLSWLVPSFPYCIKTLFYWKKIVSFFWIFLNKRVLFKTKMNLKQKIYKKSDSFNRSHWLIF